MGLQQTKQETPKLQAILDSKKSSFNKIFDIERLHNHVNSEAKHKDMRILIDHLVKECTVEELCSFIEHIWSYNITYCLYMLSKRPRLVNVRMRGDCMLIHHAIWYYSSIVPELIALGADINQCSGYGSTPLDYAYHDHDGNVARILLQAGASTHLGIRRWRWDTMDRDLARDVKAGRLSKEHEYSFITRFIRRCHYLSLLFRIQLLTEHKRVVIEMLV